MTASTQAALSHLADEFGSLEERRAGSTALSPQCHSIGQQGDLATQQRQSHTISLLLFYLIWPMVIRVLPHLSSTNNQH